MPKDGTTSKPALPPEGPTDSFRSGARNVWAGVRRTVQFTRGGLDLDPRRDLNRAQRLLARNLRVIFLVVRVEVYRRVELHAQALTMKTLLSLVPLLVVTFAVLSAFGGGLGSANQQIIETAITYLAGTEDLQQRLMTYIGTAHIKEAELGIVTIVILVVTVMSLLGHVETTFNTLFGVTMSRPFGVRLLSYWTLLTLGPMLLLVSLGLTAAFQTSIFGLWLEGLGDVGRLAVRSTPLLVTWAAFAVLYLGVPNTRVRVGSAALAAILAGTVWNGAKYFFAWYVHHNVTVRDIYGSLAAVPMFILWLYISWVIVLGGAQLCFAFQHAATYRAGGGEDTTHAVKEQAICRLFLEIARGFFAGSPPARAEVLGPELGIPARLLKELVNHLHSGGFVRPVEGGGLVPAGDLSTITVDHLVTHLREGVGHDVQLSHDERRAGFDRLFNELDAKRHEIAGAVSFRELVDRYPSPCPEVAPDDDANPSL